MVSSQTRWPLDKWGSNSRVYWQFKQWLVKISEFTKASKTSGRVWPILSTQHLLACGTFQSGVTTSTCRLANLNQWPEVVETTEHSVRSVKAFHKRRVCDVLQRSTWGHPWWLLFNKHSLTVKTDQASTNKWIRNERFCGSSNLRMLYTDWS